MRKVIRAWVRSCLACQTAKNHHHTRTPLQPIPTPTECFHTVHMDLIGPLLSSRGCRYLLTCVDRTTRWGAAIPMLDSTAETTPTHFLSGWVSHFGAPVTIITDQGVQFESRAWAELLAFLGTVRQRTTAYHPQANGMVTVSSASEGGDAGAATARQLGGGSPYHSPDLERHGGGHPPHASGTGLRGGLAPTRPVCRTGGTAATPYSSYRHSGTPWLTYGQRLLACTPPTPHTLLGGTADRDVGLP